MSDPTSSRAGVVDDLADANSDAESAEPGKKKRKYGSDENRNLLLMQEMLKQNQQQNQQLMNQNQESQQQIQQLMNQNQESQQQIQQLMKQIQDVMKQNQQLNAKLDNLQAETQETKAEMKETNVKFAEQIQNEIKETKAEMKETNVKFAEQSAKLDKIQEDTQGIAALKAGASRKGVTTQAQFYQEIYQNQSLDRHSNLKGIWNGKANWPLDFPTPPNDGTGESDKVDKDKKIPGVQTFFTNVLKSLIPHTKKKDKVQSIPDPEAFRKCSFGTRKPDVVNYAEGKNGALGITSFGELKGRRHGDFADEEKGHVLDMARSYMEDFGFNRPFLIVFLSDGVRWQFFRVVRQETSFRYLEGCMVSSHEEGWRMYLALLEADLKRLGYVIPKIPNIELEEPLGRGGSACVYQGEVSETKEKVVVKVYMEDRDIALEAEDRALTALQGIENVPKKMKVEEMTEKVDGSLGKVLVATPVGTPVLPTQRGIPVNGTHLKQLVMVLKEAHALDLAHRDIKPDNIYLFDNKIILNDWSSSVKISVQDGAQGGNYQRWEGTIGFSVHPEETKFHKLCSKQRDLVNLVRCAYSLLFKELPPYGEGVCKIEEYWSCCFRENTRWAIAMKHAENLKYEALGTLFEVMK